MFKLVWPDELLDSVIASEKRIKKERKKLMEVLGVQLLSFISLDYILKSRGSTGAKGIRWKKLLPRTEVRKDRRSRKRTGRVGRERGRIPTSDIGVDTGLQKASASPGFRSPDSKGGNIHEFSDDQVTVGFGRDYSEDFDKVRTLIPDPLPLNWERELEKITVETVNKILEEEIGK